MQERQQLAGKLLSYCREWHLSAQELADLITPLLPESAKHRTTHVRTVYRWREGKAFPKGFHLEAIKKLPGFKL